MPASEPNNDRDLRQRRRRGSGSITYHDRLGRWMGQTSQMAGGRRVRKTVYGATRDEAEQKLAAVSADMRIAPPTPRPPTTIEVARRKATHTRAEWEAKRDAISCCVYCGATNLPLTKDHATPVGLGGDDSIANVVPACADCNAAKGNTTAAQYVIWRLVNSP